MNVARFMNPSMTRSGESPPLRSEVDPVIRYSARPTCALPFLSSFHPTHQNSHCPYHSKPGKIDILSELHGGHRSVSNEGESMGCIPHRGEHRRPEEWCVATDVVGSAMPNGGAMTGVRCRTNRCGDCYSNSSK